MIRSCTLIVGVFMLMLPLFSAGQGVNNLDFESWTTNAFGVPAPTGFERSYEGQENTSSPYNGTSAFRLNTAYEGSFYSDTMGVAFNGTWTTGVGESYTKRPDTLSGFLRYSIPAGDTGLVLAQLTKYDASTDSTHVLGDALTFLPSDTISTWSPFELEFLYDTCATPDSITFIFASETNWAFGIGNSTIGGYLELDSLELHTPAPTIDNIVTSDVLCGNDGSIEIQTSNVDSCTMYSIDGGSSYQNDSIFNGLTSGTYQLEVMTANGTATGSVTVGGDSVQVDSVDVTDSDCGLSNGSFTIHASGGTEPYQFSNDNGSTYKTDSTFTGLSSGIYDIAVKDDNGCVYNDQVSVGTNSTLSIDSVSIKEKEACGMNDGKMTVHASGGTKPYTFSIDGGGFQADSTFTGLSAGDHDLTVQDAGGCTDDSLNIYLDSVMAPTISGVNVTDATCGMNDGEIEVNASGGQGSLMYSNDGGSNYQGGFTFSGLSTGMYKTMVKDTNGCKDSMTVEVDTNLVPMAMAASDTDSVDLANSGTVNFDGSGSQGNTYTWYFGDGNSATGMTASHTYSSTGTYTVWLVAEAGNCVDSSMVTIDVVNTSSIAGPRAEEADFEVRPNPSSGRFEVEMERTRNGSIEVLDVMGRVVHTESIDATHRSSIDMSDEEEGVYFLRLIDENGKAIGTRRLMLAD